MDRKCLSKLWLAVALGAGPLLSLSGGCALAVGAAAGAGGVAWFEGKLTTTEGYGYDTVAEASNRAVAQLHLAKINEAHDSVSDTITARTASDTKVTLKIYRSGERVARVEIRVGVFGDRALSQLILERIRSNLGA